MYFDRSKLYASDFDNSFSVIYDLKEKKVEKPEFLASRFDKSI